MILLIAYGNPLRQDDGAGLRMAEQMAERWRAVGAPVRHVTAQQLTPELAVEIAEPDVKAVVLVDTRAAAVPTRTVAITPLTRPDAATPSLGHHFSPDVLLAYAALLLDGRPTPPAWLVTVPGVAFDHREGLSETASTALDAALTGHDRPLQQLMDDLTAMHAPQARSHDSACSDRLETH